MARPVTLYTLQWGDLSLETVCQKAKEFGYDGVESLPIWLDKLFAIISMSVIRQSCRITFGEMAIRKGFTNGLPRR